MMIPRHMWQRQNDERGRDGLEHQIDVSVIVLTYYHERYIRKALDSILAQKTQLRYEILIGDDASQDGTQAIIKEYAESYPDVIKPTFNAQNVGATQNSINLVQKARGRYIATLEGDDYWLDPLKMQKQWEFLESNSQYIGCCSKCTVVDENDHSDYTASPQFVWNKKNFTLDNFLATWQMPGQASTLMCRNIYAQMRPEDYSIYFTAHRNVGDKTSMLFLLSKGPIYCSNEILSCYRFIRHKGGHNYFSLHYSNPYRHYDMFMYPCRLETWARKHLGLHAHLGPRKEVRFARFVEETVKEPSLKRFKCLAEMIACSHEPGHYLWYVLKTLIERED